MIINGQDTTKVARREYGRMFAALYAEPFGNQHWAQNVVNAWQKLEPTNDLRGLIQARFEYGLTIDRIAEIWELKVYTVSTVINDFLTPIDREFHDHAIEGLFDLW